MKKFYFLIFFLFLSNFIFSFNQIDAINNPTSEVIDYGLGCLNVRMYHSGGIVTRFVFAPFNRLNFGGSLDIDKLIGDKDPLFRDPAFYFKWRIFDGNDFFPAISLGYDGQGYYFVDKEYRVPQKGLFLVFSLNFFLDKFFLDFGTNITKYNNENKLFLFISSRFIYQEIVYLAIEYENIGKTEVQQLNFKLGFILAKLISVDLIFNNLYSQNIKINRELRINYIYKFF